MRTPEAQQIESGAKGASTKSLSPGLSRGGLPGKLKRHRLWEWRSGSAVSGEVSGDTSLVSSQARRTQDRRDRLGE